MGRPRRPILLYRPKPAPYVPRRFKGRRSLAATEQFRKPSSMRAETEYLVDEIKQAIALLRRHL
jgi:hypothetical protein